VTVLLPGDVLAFFGERAAWIVTLPCPVELVRDVRELTLPAGEPATERAMG